MVFLIYNLTHQTLFQHILLFPPKFILFLCRLKSCLYSINMILFFLHILISWNYNFYLFPILIDYNWLVYSWKIFFFISMANTVSEKSCCLIVWSWYQIITFWFSCYKLDIAIFSHVFYGFLKNCIVYQLEKKIIMDKY